MTTPEQRAKALAYQRVAEFIVVICDMANNAKSDSEMREIMLAQAYLAPKFVEATLISLQQLDQDAKEELVSKLKDLVTRYDWSRDLDI